LVGVGAVRVQGQLGAGGERDLAADAGDDSVHGGDRERAALGVAVVAEHARGGGGEVGVLVGRAGVVDGDRGVVDAVDRDRDRGRVRLERAVGGPVGGTGGGRVAGAEVLEGPVRLVGVGAVRVQGQLGAGGERDLAADAGD